MHLWHLDKTISTSPPPAQFLRGSSFKTVRLVKKQLSIIIFFKPDFDLKYCQFYCQYLAPSQYSEAGPTLCFTVPDLFNCNVDAFFEFIGISPARQRIGLKAYWIMAYLWAWPASDPSQALPLYFFCSMSGRGEKNAKNGQKWPKKNQLKQCTLRNVVSSLCLMINNWISLQFVNRNA